MGKINSPVDIARFIWGKWSPGVCIAVLAGAAAVFPIVTPSELTPTDKAKWIAGFGFLMVLELVIIFKERGRQDREFAQDQAKRDAAHYEQLKNLQELRQASEAHNTAIMRQFVSMNDPAGSLKKRALDLSEAILNFIYSRIQGKPEEPIGYSYIFYAEDLQTSLQKSNERSAAQFRVFNYSKETTRFYLARFQERAIAIRNELAEHKLPTDGLDSALDSASKGLAGDDLIRFIGEQIGNLAEMCNTKILDNI